MNFHVGLFDVSEALMRIGHSGVAEIFIDTTHGLWSPYGKPTRLEGEINTYNVLKELYDYHIWFTRRIQTFYLSAATKRAKQFWQSYSPSICYWKWEKMHAAFKIVLYKIHTAPSPWLMELNKVLNCLLLCWSISNDLYSLQCIRSRPPRRVPKTRDEQCIYEYLSRIWSTLWECSCLCPCAQQNPVANLLD